MTGLRDTMILRPNNEIVYIDFAWIVSVGKTGGPDGGVNSITMPGRWESNCCIGIGKVLKNCFENLFSAYRSGKDPFDVLHNEYRWSVFLNNAEVFLVQEMSMIFFSLVFNFAPISRPSHKRICLAWRAADQYPRRVSPETMGSDAAIKLFVVGFFAKYKLAGFLASLMPNVLIVAVVRKL